MTSSVKQFIDSLEGQVAELPDIELADLAEDSKALWARNKTTEDGEADPIEFSRRRIIATQELGDERYRGQKVSSKNIFTGDDMSDLAQVVRNTNAGTSEDLDLENEDSSSADSNSVASSSDQESFSADDNVEDEEREDSEQSQSKKKSDAANGVVSISSDTQHEKAESVRKQLVIWDQLMQLHILSHAALRAFNQLPREELARKLQLSADDDTRKSCRLMRKNLEQLNEIFSTMEDRLLKSSKQTKSLLSNGNDGERIEDSEDEEIESSIGEGDGSVIESGIKDSEGDTTNDNEMANRGQKILGKRKKLMPKELMKEYERRHNRFTAFRSSALSKWDERTTLSTIGVMKNKKRDFSGFESLILRQIEQIMNEKHRLLRRTQLKRHNVDRIGTDESNDYDSEIFDDDDFYQQLLKELIERKSANVVDPVEMSRQWLEIQKLREKRSKRKKVDTKASKGRKIRYVAIPKLVNFFPSMAEKATWSHEKRNHLFKSLFS
uniref:Protein AATF n=1 Tax=Elaeophora elaphi TaxID=1147741 RepID=A0A0R3RGE4_9BILA